MAQRIREHRIALLMTREEVRDSLGEPIARSQADARRETWFYADREINFGDGKMIDSRVVAPNAEVTPGRRLTWMPGVNRYVEHAANVSAMQSVGGGGGPVAPATPAQSAAERKLRDQWGWGKSGSALDKR